MNALFVEFLEANLAAAAAIVAVMWARRHVHRLLGPGAAYLLWLVVPVAMLATLIPAREVLVSAPAVSSPDDLWSAAILPVIASVLAFVWIAGAIAMTALMIQRQRVFLADVDLGQAGPAVVGFFHPRIVTPTVFAQHFNVSEQKLILAHEQVHLERGDARINAAVALARCLCWFNPLVHIGAKHLRTDQELSCDAIVLDRRPKSRRAYAETLLKTQMQTRALPVGCYWQAEALHPLAERIAMLTRGSFSHHRRLAAAASVLVLVGGGGVAAWAAQPAREIVAADEERIVWADDLPEVFLQFIMLAPDERMQPREDLIYMLPASEAPIRPATGPPNR